MKSALVFKTANTILYCQKWSETVVFYRDRLQLPVTFATEWFVEFEVSSTARLSVANERRAKVKSSNGGGITITLEVENADAAWMDLHGQGLELESVRDHPWGARAFYLYDPEGYRLEIWSSKLGKRETGR